MLEVNEHTDADEINLGSGTNGLLFHSANHASRIGRVMAQRVTRPVAFDGRHSFSIEQLDIEHSITAAGATNPADLGVGNGYQVTQADFSDPSNFARGFVNWHVVKGNVGPDDLFTIDGAAQVQFRQLGEAIPAISRLTQPSSQSLANDVDTAVRLQPHGAAEGVSMNGADQIVFARKGTYRITARVAFAARAPGYRRLQIEIGGTGSSDRLGRRD